MAMFHINRSGTGLGVFDEARVREGLRTGEFIGTDLAWTEGMPSWRPLSDFESFASPAAVPPPPASPPAAPQPAPEPQTAAQPPLGGLPPSAVPTPTAVDSSSGLPWETRRSENFIKALIDTIVLVLTQPAQAFSQMRREGGLLDPLLYAVIIGTIGALVTYIYSLIISLIGVLPTEGGFMNVLGAGGATSFAALIFAPVMVVIGLFIGSGIVHLCLMATGGAKRGFETTLRVLSYASGSSNVFQVVPICGGLIAAIVSLVLNCIGLARAHETDTWRAVVAVLGPLIICGGGCLLLFILVFGSMGAMMR